jgi:dolichol kinase
VSTALHHDEFTVASGAIALELHRLLAELDRSRFRWRQLVRAHARRLLGVRARLAELVSRSAAARAEAASVRAKVLDLHSAVEAHAPTSEVRADWLAFRTRIVPQYESLAESLRDAAIHVPSLRPKNYARNVFHVANAATALAILELVRSWDTVIAIAWSCALAGWAMEISRRASPAINARLMSLFRPFAHPHEAHRINSATWYVTAIALLATTREIVPCALAMVVLGVGDPIAAVVGRRWGRVRWVNGRSVEGTLAFVIAAASAGFALLTLGHGIAWPAALAVAGAAALLGAFAELYSRRVDDNLSVPVMAWVGALAAALVVSL